MLISDPVNLIKIILVIGIPLWLLLTRNHKGMLFWIGMTIGVEILDVQLVASLSPLNIVGLLCLPFAIHLFPQVVSTRIGKLIVFSFLLLVLLGLIYGYVYPWPDLTGLRPWNQRAEGRSIIYLIRVATNFSVAIYMAHILQQNEQYVAKFLRYLLIGTTIAAVGVLIEYFFRIDLFAFFTSGARTWDVELIGRVRGFNGEPRVSGQVVAWGILLLVGLKGLGKWRWGLMFVHLVAFIVIISAASLVILVAGLVVLIVFSPTSRARRLSMLSGLFIFSFLFVQFSNLELTFRWADHVTGRLFTRTSVANDPANLGEAIANRLEVFDASAVLFLWDNPQHIILGTGPGLVSLPASRYIPDGARAIYGERIDSIPHMGLVQILANSGIVGVFLWIAIFLSCWKALRDKADSELERDTRHEILSLFLAFSAIYLLQERTVWYLFLGVALSIAMENAKRGKATNSIKHHYASHLIFAQTERISIQFDIIHANRGRFYSEFEPKRPEQYLSKQIISSSVYGCEASNSIRLSCPDSK